MIFLGYLPFGVIVSLNPRRDMVFVQRCADSRALFQRPYARITGPQKDQPKKWKN